MNEIYAVFYGQINEQSAQTLIRHLSNAAKNAKAVHLLFHSSGGLASDGVGLYNYLRTYSIPISIYNMSCLQSAAVSVYLGAQSRIVCHHATFMVHGAYIKAPLVLEQNEESLGKLLDGIKAVNNSVEHILKSHLKDFSGLDGRELWFSAQEALEVGIATSISDFAPPKGTRIENFF